MWVFEDGTFVPIAKLQNGKSYSIITDHLGTPFEAYNEEGAKVWTRQLDIYGKTKKETGEVNFIPYLYQGQYFDVDTELAYNRFRYYSVESGGYISQDPIGLAGGMPNMYAYVEDLNSRIDPFGLYDPFDFQFTQESIGDTFKQGDWKGMKVQDAIDEAIETGKLPKGLELKFEKILTGNGEEVWATLNNRTLYVAQQANLVNINAIDMDGKGGNQYNKLVNAPGGGIQESGFTPEVKPCK